MAKKKRPKPRTHPSSPWPDWLKKMRKGRGRMTQAEAAGLAGVALRTWISWENAHRIPSGPSLQLLLRTFPELKKNL